MQFENTPLTSSKVTITLDQNTADTPNIVCAAPNVDNTTSGSLVSPNGDYSNAQHLANGKSTTPHT